MGSGARRVLAGRAARRLPLGLGHGLRLELDPSSPLDMYVGLYESELVPHVRRLCAPGRRCFDIGGFDGYYSLVMARLTGAEVVAFDADPAACERIRRNCAANPPAGERVSVRRAFVAFETNRAENCIAIDDALRNGELFVPDVVKVDVDRAEASVLSGASGLLATRRPHLIVEVHSVELERECGDLLLEHGYRPVVVTPRRFLAQNRPIEHNRWLVAEGSPR